MLTEKNAITVKERSLAAIKELNLMLMEIQADSTQEDFDAIKRGAGLTIGRIQMELLEYINR
jgi:hypothetical protein